MAGYQIPTQLPLSFPVLGGTEKKIKREKIKIGRDKDREIIYQLVSHTKQTQCREN